MHTVSSLRSDVAGQTQRGRPIRVMVVDDSVVIRGLIARILGRDPGIEVVASVGNGKLAVESLSRKPADVVILDIEMPVMDGLTALPRLLAVDPKVKVIIASTLSTRNAGISIRCLEAGAADYLPKPTAARDISSGANGGEVFARELLEKVRALGVVGSSRAEPTPGARPTRPSPPAPRPPAAIQLRPPSPIRPQILAVGSSTGGPQALRVFLGSLGPSFPLPIVIVQHMPPTFTSILAQHIADQCGRPCAEVQDGEPLSPGKTYLAPGDFHLRLLRSGTQTVARLSQDPAQNFCRPAVDPLFRSTAEVFARQTLAVVLTGMGSDGLNGARDIVGAGGTVLAQDEKTSVVWGMPGAVASAGLCSVVAPIGDLAGHVTALAKGHAR